MSSTQRAYAQRNNNVTTLVPVPNGYAAAALPPIGPDTPVALYSLNIPSVPYVGGIYIVNLSGNDSNGDPLDASGVFVSANDICANIITFNINTPNITPNAPSINPASYPGAEFTIFFKNFPPSIFEGPIPLFTIGIVANASASGFEGPPTPYIYSPPIPFLLTEDLTQSITMKSDGTTFSVVSSGPAGWIGGGLLQLLVSAAGEIYGGGP